MNWNFLQAANFQLLTAIVSYLGGFSLLIARRRRHPDAQYGVRTEAGLILQIIVTVPLFGILAYLGFIHGLLAAVIAFGISSVAANILAAMKGLFYPFLE